jgi:hypothetical protein
VAGPLHFDLLALRLAFFARDRRHLLAVCGWGLGRWGRRYGLGGCRRRCRFGSRSRRCGLGACSRRCVLVACSQGVGGAERYQRRGKQPYQRTPISAPATARGFQSNYVDAVLRRNGVRAKANDKRGASFGTHGPSPFEPSLKGRVEPWRDLDRPSPEHRFHVGVVFVQHCWNGAVFLSS